MGWSNPGLRKSSHVVAGAPPPTRTIELRNRTWLGVVQIYGLTETAPLLTINRGREEWTTSARLTEQRC